MHDSIKYKQINWVDGMKIDKDHFIGLENYLNSRIHGLRFNIIDEYNYGLIPTDEGYEHTIKFIPEIDNQHLKVSLLNCQAITRGGFWVDIAGYTNNGLGGAETTIEKSELHDGKYYLILSLDPYSRMPIGKVSATEDPLRLPNVCPKFKLDLSKTDDGLAGKLGNDILIIGKIVYKDNSTDVDNDYIPPCASIKSHPKLLKFYAHLKQSMHALEQNIVELIAEINLRESTNILTTTILHLSEKLLMFLSVHATEYRWHLKNKPPIFLIDWVVTLAKIIKNAHETRTAEEKEKLLNYFYDHFDINPSKFKQLLDNTIDIEYDHNDINQSLEKAENFLNVISTLFAELKKMEFIVGGKRKTRTIDIIITK